MKFLFLVSALFLAAQATVIQNEPRMMLTDRHIMTKVNEAFWTRQMKILKLFNHYTMDNANVDQITIGKNFKLTTLLDTCDDKTAVKKFIVKMRDDLILHKNIIFSITNKMHRENVKYIVDIFLTIKNFEDFYEFACWAREFMNQDLFLYTLSVAVFHRTDCRGMMIPRMYEIVPNKFFNDDVIEMAKKIKMQGEIFDKEEAQRLGVTKVDDRTFVMNTFYSCWFLDTNKECKLNYFTEDVDLNHRYNLLHLFQPFWLRTDENTFYMNRRGEYFLFVHKTLLTRYYLERLSNDMGTIPTFKYDLPIVTGMTSTLKHVNGLIMPSRPNNFLVNTIENIWNLKKVKDYERRLRDAVDRGYITTDDGKQLYLNRPQDIELLGNMIESNADSPTRNFYLNGLLIAKKLLGNGMDTTNRMFAAPSILEQYETALRDPMFWQLWKRIYHYVMKFKYNLRPYTIDEVGFEGVKVTGVSTGKLETFFDSCVSDISTVVNRDLEEVKTNRDKFTFIARQPCLNHRKFDVKIDYVSDITTNAVVKIFLGPKFDEKGMRTTSGEDFMLLDDFLVQLKTGENTIVRESTKFWYSVKEETYTKMMQRVHECMRTGCDVNVHQLLRLPHRLLLPKGKRGGMIFKLFVSVTPFKNTNVYNKFDVNKYVGRIDSDHFIDDNALGFPLDREIDLSVFRRCTNMITKDVVIYHDTTTPMMSSEMFEKMTRDPIVRSDVTDRHNIMYDMDKNTIMDDDKEYRRTMHGKTTNMMTDDITDRFMYKSPMDRRTLHDMDKHTITKDDLFNREFSDHRITKDDKSRFLWTKDFYNKNNRV